MQYSTKHIIELFNISHTTVKTWSASYAQFLSDSAKPGENRHRSFTVDDLKVFSFVAYQKKRGVSHDEIFLSLANGERGELPPTHMEVSMTMDSREQVMLLQNHVQQLQAEIERLKPFERETIELNAVLRKTESDLEKTKAEIRDLYREIAQLEARSNSSKE